VSEETARHGRLAEGALLLIAAIWGFTFPLLRESLRTLDPYELMALRFTVAAVALGAVTGRRLMSVSAVTLWDGLRTGAFIAAGYLTQMIGLQTIGASRSAFLTGTTLVLVPFASYAILRLGPGAGEWLGVAIAFAGLLLFYADAGFSLRAGDLWTLACAAAFAFQIVYTNIAARRSDPIVVALLQTLVAATVGWTFLAGRGGFSTPLRAVPWPTIFYLAVVATSFVLALQTWALGKTKPVRAGIIYTMEPVFAALFAMSLFGERMSGREILGSAAILCGVLVAELWRPGRVRGGP
jgi:drug/metabolite transporter (DMT)-like permease